MSDPCRGSVPDPHGGAVWEGQAGGELLPSLWRVLPLPQGQDPQPNVCPQELRTPLSFQSPSLDPELNAPLQEQWPLICKKSFFPFFAQCWGLRGATYSWLNTTKSRLRNIHCLLSDLRLHLSRLRASLACTSLKPPAESKEMSRKTGGQADLPRSGPQRSSAEGPQPRLATRKRVHGFRPPPRGGRGTLVSLPGLAWPRGSCDWT